jgi:large subunit ribosomal protein L9
MKVILCEDVDNLGGMGETVRVASGYARNFLLPRKLAVAADSASARQIEHEMRIIRKKEEKRRVELTEVAKGMASLQVEMLAKAGENGKLFGSITTLHIVQKLQDLGYEVNRRKIVLEEPIKSLGEHKVKIALGVGVVATINISVLADEIEEQQEAVTGGDDIETDTMAAAEASAAPEEAKPEKASDSEQPAEA